MNRVVKAKAMRFSMKYFYTAVFFTISLVILLFSRIFNGECSSVTETVNAIPGTDLFILQSQQECHDTNLHIEGELFLITKDNGEKIKIYNAYISPDLIITEIKDGIIYIKIGKRLAFSSKYIVSMSNIVVIQ